MLDEKIISIAWHMCCVTRGHLVTEALSDKGKLAVRLGLKAMGQINNLTAGLP
jgi:hypothetical protein